ncbi:MAG: tRNA (adenosine(37)-N6)-dimethylallyltransferase MiaA, partial [Planctomycetes bacterium]|nr:tRNA (adenosine(37)-N6)-dimethylallyltransferase MiaA [Planctomycetota bacterium]
METASPDTTAKPLVCVILGQTASGKSTLCHNIAKRIDSEIISMDALKVYRGMDIGTAKASPADQQAVPHHLLDLAAPSESFNVARYLDDLEGVIRDVLNRGHLPLIDCGTPLYLKTFLSGMLESPEPDEELRAELETMSSTALHRRLATLDPEAAATLHANDRKRVIRAVQYAMQTGKPISAERTQFETRRTDYRFVLTGPLWDEAILRARIEQRVERMMTAGLIDEVVRIHNGEGFSKTAREAIGYRQLLEHLEGAYSLEEAVEKIKRRTWQLARKQMV